MDTKQISCNQKLWLNTQNLESDNHLFYTIRNWFDELHGRRIHASFHGWLILSDHPDNVLWSLWNPLNSDLICLPPLITNEKDSYACCLSSPPEVQGSVFLLLSCSKPIIFVCLLDHERKRFKWTKRSYAKQLQAISGEDNCLLRRPTCCNGKVYAVVFWSYNFVIQLDIVVKGTKMVISLLPFAKIPFDSRPLSRCPYNNSIDNCYYFLEGSSIDLFYINVGYKDKLRKTVAEACLFKLDMTSKSWTEMADLEDAAFFIELASGYACYYNCAVESKLGGYIHIVGECGKVIYSFHVKDRTLSLFYLPCLVRESQAFSWAMLEWRRLEVDRPEEKKEDKDTEIFVRPVKGGSDSTTGESHLLNMPLHILEFIMEFCIGVEYMKFRATCKRCCLAAPLIQWSNKTRLRSYSLVSPWLMVLDDYQDTITFIDPMLGDRYFIKTPQQLKGGYEIFYSRYGWLLMYNQHEFGLVLFNPFTGNIRELPDIPCVESFCFSGPPTSPDCMVVGFSSHGSWHLFVHFVSGESIWGAYDLNDNPFSLQFNLDPYSFKFPTFRGRYIYGLCNNERIEAFRDIANDGYDWELVVDKAPSRDPAQYFLSICDQHLLLVIVGEFEGSVEVFKLDESTQEWEKINDLGKHSIYISNTSCLCLEAKSPEMGNKIYFPRLLHDDNTKIVFYSFETCKYHTFDDKNIQESFSADIFGSKHLCFPHAWIEPSWS